jgi:hypothetical protein
VENSGRAAGGAVIVVVLASSILRIDWQAR